MNYCFDATRESSSVRAPFVSYIYKMSSKLDEIDDIQELCGIVKLFNLSTEGLKTFDQMKARLSEHLQRLEGSSTRKVGEVSTHTVLLF